MTKNDERSKFSVRINTQLLALADDYIQNADTNLQSRTELLEEALRFYLGFLTTQKAEDYLLQTLSSVITSTMQNSENHLARMDFKIAVELAKLCHVIAYSHDVDEEALSRLHIKCLDEVKRINGAIDFESAYKYQKREM